MASHEGIISSKLGNLLFPITYSLFPDLGLLSLRSVLASSQIYQQTTKQQDNKTTNATVGERWREQK